MRKNSSIALAIRQVYKHRDFWRILVDESEAQSGPFDGGCLICAKAIIRAAGGGKLVRMTSPQCPAEHFGALIDGAIYDFNGRHGSPGAWIKRFVQKESIMDRVFEYAEGFHDEAEAPDDPQAEKNIARLLFWAMEGKLLDMDRANKK